MIKIKNCTNLSYEIIGSVIDWYLKNYQIKRIEEGRMLLKDFSNEKLLNVHYFDFCIKENKYRMEVNYQKKGVFCVYKLK